MSLRFFCGASFLTNLNKSSLFCVESDLFSVLFNSHIDLESHDLTKGVLGELLVTNLENTYLLVRYCGEVVLINVLLEMCVDIGNAVLLDIILIGINLSNDGVVHKASLALSLVNYDIDNAGNCDELRLNLLGVNVLTVGENDEVLLSTGDVDRTLLAELTVVAGRKKNLIILSNGKNVYPEEIEAEFIAVPGVIDIVVYEGQSKRGLEHNAIVAEVYPDKDYIEKNNVTDIHAHLKKYVDEYNLTAVPYKKIAILKVRDDEFPKNTLRKIMRFKIDMTID